MNARSKASTVIGIKLVCLLAVGLLYLRGLPKSVQGLDTGELVAGAYNFTVVHPPGYPAYLWLQHVATHLPLGDSVFWRAALCSMALALVTLALVSFVGHVTLAAFATLVMPLALQGIFWRYALLPDVFMLHACFTASVLVIALGIVPSAKRTWLLALTWGVGLANHQTLVLLAPVVLVAMWEGVSRGTFARALTAACAVCAASYLTIFAMHPDSITAWGDIKSTHDWLRHVLRREYGTLRLARTDAGGTATGNLWAFAQSTLQSIPFALGMTLFAPLWRWARAGRVFWAAWVSVVGSTILFLLAANVGQGPILERFFLMPIVGITVLALAIMRTATNKPSHPARVALAAGALVVSLSHVMSDLTARNLSEDTIVEDYAQNLLTMASAVPQPVLLAEGDSVLNALRYVQHVQGIHADIPVISTTGVPLWRVAQLRHMQPALLIADTGGRGIGAERLMSDLVTPSQPAVTFFANAVHGLDMGQQRQTYLGLGRRLEPGTGVSVDTGTFDALRIRSTPGRYLPSDEVNEAKVLFAGYAMGDLVAGKLTTDPTAKRQHFARALQRVPYCWPAFYELCRLDGRASVDCRAAAQELRTRDADYF